jgi:hypothetical protein
MQAVTDAPCVIFYKELLKAYPEAKVIITVRDSPEQWVSSQMNTLVKYTVTYLNQPPPRGLKAMYDLFRPARRPIDTFMDRMTSDYEMWTTLLADARNGTTQNSEAYYLAHIESIRRLIPADNLLIMNVSEGCK